MTGRSPTPAPAGRVRAMCSRVSSSAHRRQHAASRGRGGASAGHSSSRRAWPGAIRLALGIAVAACCTVTFCHTAAARVVGDASGAGTSSRTFVAGQSLALPFPRLESFWPDPAKVSLAQIARFDLVVLGVGYADILPRLKALNPNMLALASTNACEVQFDPGATASSPENDEVKHVPAQWLLTQVGSRLSGPVDATTTILKVDRVTLPSGDTTLKLFVPGDYVVLDDEIACVRQVDAVNCTLVVQRGCVKQATSHATGTRVAAAISYWPGTLMADVSTYCPRVVVDAAIGSETWGEYNARVGAGLLASPYWDGAYIDRSEANESWIVGNSTARTVDADRSNSLPSSYASFDAAWNSGLRLYESRLRTLVGSGRLLVANWGMPNYDLLNGTNFERFPDGDGAGRGESWASVVFGEGLGSYADWMANALQPRVSSIQTYQASSSADSPAGSAQNYRNMRFGLCTALLNDGFYSYESANQGGGSPGVAWFDEYDNAGKGRDYLGQPLGPARRAVSALRTPNLAVGGAFDSQSDIDSWSLDVSDEGGYAATMALDNADSVVGGGSARIDISRAGGTDWGVVLGGRPVAVTLGSEYTLTFWARADRSRTIDAWVEDPDSPGNWLLDYGKMTLTTDWRCFEVSAMAAASDGVADVRIGLGQTDGTVWLDDVRLQRGGCDVWRRDFQGGVALDNASASSVAVSLDGILRKIRGKQSPTTNDGSLVSQVTLAGRDGIVLVRPVGSSRQIAVQAVEQLVRKWRASVSLCGSARDYYERLARRSTGAAKTRAARSRMAWQAAFAAATTVRDRVLRCHTALVGSQQNPSNRAGAVDLARALARGATARAALANVLAARAEHLGYASGARPDTARQAIHTGCEMLATACMALAHL